MIRGRFARWAVVVSVALDALALAAFFAALWGLLWLAPGFDAAVIDWRAE